MNKLTKLLDEVSQLKLKYRTTEIPYSLMPVIYNKIREKEVLHSDIISSLLEQSIQVDIEHILLTNFLKLIGVKPKIIQVNDLNISKEYSIDNERRIDILLHDDNNAIIVENKLNDAEDQPNQLNDYYSSIVEENFVVNKIVYILNKITKNAPLGTLSNEVKKLLTIIYPTDLINWLEKSLNQISETDFQRELINYKHLLQAIEMENKRIEENFGLANILSENENILSAYQIYERWNDIKWHTEWDFWNNFKDVIEKEVVELWQTQQYSVETVSDATHKSRNKNPWYGITFKIATWTNQNSTFNICLYIERGNANLSYGLILKDELGNWINNESELFKTLRSNIKVIQNCSYTNLWPAKIDFSPETNFESFSTRETLLLRNNKFRKDRIQKYWLEVKNFVSKILPDLKNIEGTEIIISLSK